MKRLIFIIILLVLGSVIIEIGDAERNYPLLVTGAIILCLCGLITITSIISLYIHFTAKAKDKLSKVKQQNLLKTRFHGKRKIIDETSKHHADLTRDLNKSTDKDTKDEILAEFFAGIGLDMDAIKFSEAKEIVLEELKAKK